MFYFCVVCHLCAFSYFSLYKVWVTEWPLIGKNSSLGLRYVFKYKYLSFFPPRFLEWEYLSDCAIT